MVELVGPALGPLRPSVGEVGQPLLVEPQKTDDDKNWLQKNDFRTKTK